MQLIQTVENPHRGTASLFTVDSSRHIVSTDVPIDVCRWDVYAPWNRPSAISVGGCVCMCVVEFTRCLYLQCSFVLPSFTIKLETHPRELHHWRFVTVEGRRRICMLRNFTARQIANGLDFGYCGVWGNCWPAEFRGF